jgi:hypothetical protein
LGRPLRPKICICGRLPQREVVTSPRELYITGIMPHRDLSADEAAALIKELHAIVENDRHPFSERIRTLRGILAKLRPEPPREPLQSPKGYAAPRTRRAAAPASE